MNTLIDRVQFEIERDHTEREKYSGYLTQYYEEAKETEKILIDMCFVAICGMSLTNLIARERQAQARQTTL